MAMIITSCKFLVISLIIASSLIINQTATLVLADTPVVVHDALCDSKCEVRCSKAGRKDRCLEYCGICCRDCHCVPSGTYGHKDECPCYREKKIYKGQPMCP